MNDAEANAHDQPGDIARGPFVKLGGATWVNARHVVAVAGSPIGTEPGEGATVYLDVPDPDTAGPLAFFTKTTADILVIDLVRALEEWEITKGEQRERGRLEVEGEDEREA